MYVCMYVCMYIISVPFPPRPCGSIHTNSPPPPISYSTTIPLPLLSVAFRDCSSLTSVTFQSSSALTTVGTNAFMAPGLSGGSVSIDEDKASLLKVVGKMMYNTSVNGVAFAPYGPMDGSGNVVINNSVTAIADCKLVVV